MSIRRVVPVITTQSLEPSREFYVQLFGFEVAMDMDWIVSLVSPTNPTAQIAVITRDATAPVQPQLTIEVSDVDAMHTEAVRRGDDVVYPLTDEPWGARRFFVRDPSGVVVNVVGQPVSEGREKPALARVVLHCARAMNSGLFDSAMDLTA
jgi:predicted enzyme related to lactoylglutathione lyase